MNKTTNETCTAQYTSYTAGDRHTRQAFLYTSRRSGPPLHTSLATWQTTVPNHSLKRVLKYARSRSRHCQHFPKHINHTLEGEGWKPLPLPSPYMFAKCRYELPIQTSGLARVFVPNTSNASCSMNEQVSILWWQNFYHSKIFFIRQTNSHMILESSENLPVAMLLCVVLKNWR